MIAFRADGTYAALHDRARPESVLHGTWLFHRGVVTLRECRFHPATGDVSGPVEYEFTLAPVDRSALAGRTPGGVRVALADPRR